jgi:hypothetical protein
MSEYTANLALQPIDRTDARHLAAQGWKVGANALAPVKPRQPAPQPQRRGIIARLFGR